MLDTFTAIAGALACTGTGFVCGLIAGRSAVTVIRRDTSEQRSLALLENNCGPPVFPPAGRESRQGFSPTPPSLRLTMPKDKGPVWAVMYNEQWYFTQAAFEIQGGQLRHWEYERSAHVEWTVPYGQWVRMR